MILAKIILLSLLLLVLPLQDDNQFNSTGEWTAWKTPNAEYPEINARVRCIVRGYNVQFKNSFPEDRVMSWSWSSNRGEKSFSAVVKGRGAVSRQIKMDHSCGNRKSSDIFVTIDEVRNP